MTDWLAIRDFATEMTDDLNEGPVPVTCGQGVVTDTTSLTGYVGVRLFADSGVDSVPMRYLSTYTPTLNDVVRYLRYGDDGFILGALEPTE